MSSGPSPAHLSCDADGLAGVGHHDDAVVIGDRDRADDQSVALAGDDGADADSAATCLAEIFDTGAFAIAIFTDDEEVRSSVTTSQETTCLLPLEGGAANATSNAADGAHLS